MIARGTSHKYAVWLPLMIDDDDNRSNEILAAIVAVSVAEFVTLVLWAIFG